ncbi:MAG TPA: AAA family ATPase [Nocardioidaceae bacterium]|nr:AAA family ATPase [Nocardioidaceae bacterium]
MLRGREREQVALDEVVERARQGSGAPLLLRGQPGVGKSALLAAAAARATDLTVLRAQGVESEAPLPFAALHRLLRPVLDGLDRIPTRQADALRSAFGETTDAVGDRHLIYLATLNLLSEAGTQNPVLVVVDDAHWLDDASAAALLFSARRLDSEAVSILFAVRDEAYEHIDLSDLPVLTVAGVDEEAAGALIADQVPVHVAPEVRTELITHTRGNPLGLVELTRALSPEQLSGRERLPSRLPLTRGVEAAFLDRYRRLPKPAQTLLLVAAADDSGQVATITRAAATLGAGAEALDAAEESGLLRAESGGGLVLHHPLVRSAIYGAATTSRRRQAHRALAEALADSAEDDRRAWHLAASADQPDEDVVAALDGAAERARRRGGHEAAAAAWSRAAELTVDADARARRLFEAARSSLLAGRPGECDQHARAALVDATDVALRVELLQLQGQVEWNTRSLDEGYRIVCQAAMLAGSSDPDRARVLAMLAASLASFGARAADAPQPRTLAPPVSSDAGPVERVTGWLLEGLCAVNEGDWKRASARLHDAWGTTLPPDAPALVTANLAVATFHLGEDDLAIARNDQQLQEAREQGAVNMVEHALTRGAVFRIATGAWSEATSAAEEAVLLDRNLGLDDLLPFPLAELALLAALRGDPSAPQRLGELVQATTLRPPRGVIGALVTSLAGWATARQEGIPADTALRHLEQITSPFVRGVAALDRVENAVRAGRSDLAEAWTQELRGFAEGTGMAWAWAAACHGEAVLGDGDPEDKLRQALAWHARSSRIPARARTQLALGEYLRRHRRRADAREHLRGALDTFESLGARLLAERARHELRASGETARRGAQATTGGLTPQESQVAALVRQGMANREVAARLFISPRTVDFHLRNVYVKLGITSRTELAALADVSS